MFSFMTTRYAAISTTGALLGVALIPAGSASAVDGCGAGATLVADGICEVTFTETPDLAWTPPAGITKLQALLVGGGGAVGSPVNEYGGGGGDVVLVELAATGDVEIVVGVGGLHTGDVASSSTTIDQGSLSDSAAGGENSGMDDSNSGGDSGNDFQGGQYGGGGGAGGAGSNESGGQGLIVNEIDDDFDLFANDDRCFGGGGVDQYSYTFEIGGSPAISVYAVGVSCGGDNGGVLLYPESAVNDGSGQMQFLGTISDLTLSPTLPNTGNGGASIKGAVSSREDGSDGIVVLRYDTALAATGFDATGSVIAGVALTAAGVFFARRRQLAS
jgi:LPXTG-motif cell wall-anchored protein